MASATRPLGSLRAFERWLLPGECLLCLQPTGGAPDDPLVCAVCRSRWRPVPDPVCGRCGQPEIPGLACRLCADWGETLSRVRSAVWLDAGPRRAVHHLKYDGWWRVAEAMADAMRRLEPLAHAQVLVPVPLARRRERERGYNQSQRLAAALARWSGGRVLAGALARTRETRSQTALTPEARRANVEGAFGARGVRGLAIVLVDDVFTTGATLLAAARALRDAGAARVDAVTFARARGPL
ncbi:MAG TPA: phosphoribosyltransferase family protein [Gemmatimonadales bacterium]|nr:phosphoribosyltransferase family protein [Gemmatimonadales bacterium]